MQTRSMYVIIDSAHRLVDFLYRAALAPAVTMGDAHPASVEITRVEWVPAEFAVARIEASADRVNRKLRYFDSHLRGGLNFFDDTVD